MCDLHLVCCVNKPGKAVNHLTCSSHILFHLKSFDTASSCGAVAAAAQ